MDSLMAGVMSFSKGLQARGCFAFDGLSKVTALVDLFRHSSLLMTCLKGSK